MKKLKAILTTLSILFVIVVSTASAADNANVNGEWALSVETPNGTGTPTVTFKQDGEKLTGTYKGRFGDSSIKGTIKGNDIKFSFNATVQGQDLMIEYSGTVDGNSMKGKVNFGGMAEGSFTGKKKSQ